MNECTQLKKVCWKVSYAIGGHKYYDEEGKHVDDSLLEEIDCNAEFEGDEYTKKGWKTIALQSLKVLSEVGDELADLRHKCKDTK